VELSRWLDELKRRRVFRALVGYGIGAFAILQVAEPVIHGLRLPEWALSAVVIALGVGFPIAVALAWVFDLKRTGIERTAPAEGQGPSRGRLAIALVGLGLLAAAPGLAYFFVSRDGSRAGPGASIAVLPFDDMSASHDQGYFADGIAEEILTALAHVEGLRVAGRTSSFSFRGKGDDLRTIAEKLKVATVLEGSVRKEGSRVRITAQLINAADGFHLWSQSFDRELNGVLAAQDEIARAVVDALKVRLGTAREPSARLRTANPEAYNEYLLGKQFFNRLNLPAYRLAEAAYDRAVKIDPSFAPGWAGLSLARFWVADEAETAAGIEEGRERAMAATEKAVAIDPGLFEAYAARGFLRSAIRWDWEGARKDFDRALDLNPGDAETNRRYAVAVLAPLGRLPSAIAFARKGTDLDPLSALAWASLGRVYYTAGQLEPAHAALERSLQIAPEQNYAAGHLCITLLLQKRPADALAAAERSASAIFRPHCSALALHDAGRHEEARRMLDDLVARSAHAAAYQVAEAYAWFGDRDRAFEWLERAYAQHDSGMPYLRADVLLRGLHGDPRFAALLRKMNLPPDDG
jgi:eukaryotic-like serine/threonine-protein kinase